MTTQLNLGNLQYMSDVGIPANDVVWYAQYAASPLGRSNADIERAERIAERAFEGLCNTIKPQYALHAM